MLQNVIRGVKLSFALSLLLILFAGCDEVSKYENYEECLLKEVQECSPVDCRRDAKDFCENYQGKQYSKAFRDEKATQAILGEVESECQKEYEEPVLVTEGLLQLTYIDEDCLKKSKECKQDLVNRYIAKTGKNINPYFYEENLEEEYKECMNRGD